MVSLAHPDRTAILARAAESLPGWRARLPARRPRLFFTAESWAGLRGRYAASTGLERTHFENALAVARQLATEPAPIYRTPEEIMRLDPGTKIFDAQQELWLRPLGDGIVALSFALALADDSAIRAKLRQMVLAMCAWPQWGTLADLAAGHTARGIAIACDWHPTIWSEDEMTQIREVLRARMEAMKDAAYGGLYWAGHYDENHNHVGVCSLGLCGLAFLDEIPAAAEWTALALDNFARVARACCADGTSAEGVPYWSYGMSFILQYLEGTRHILGTDALYAAPFLKNGNAARIHAAMPDLSGALPWGDAVPRDYYGPQHVLFRLAAQYRDPEGQFLGRNLPFEPQGGPDVRVWTALWYDPTLETRLPEALDYHARDGGIVTTRNGWSPDSYLLSFKAAFTNRNHSHLDAGALAFCLGSDWLLTTPGYGLGKGEADFWDKTGGRWNYQSNATEGQATLLINGRNQRFNFDARAAIDAFQSEKDWCWVSADLTGAYQEVTSVRRSVLHRRDTYILVLDEVQTPASATVEWLAQVPPNSEVQAGKLVAAGQAGSLEIVAVDPPGADFARRPPASPHLDVPAERLRTFALLQKGNGLRFIVALVPKRKAAIPLRFSCAGCEIRIETDDWQDQIAVHYPRDLPPRITARHRLNDGRISIFTAGD